MGGYEKSPEYGGQPPTVRGILLAVAVIVGAPVALALACSSQSEAQKGASLTGVASITDGDTIEIHGTPIRLNGYDTPESGKRCGTVNVHQKASLALADFVGSKTVTCKDTGDRNNGRVVATCSVGGVDFGDYMVSQGWGRDWPRYSDGRYCQKEKAARASKSGIWGMTCPDNVWSGRDYSGKGC